MPAIKFKEQPRALDEGALVAAAALAFFDAGTDDPKVVYADDALTVPHPITLVADAAARFPPIYWDFQNDEVRATLTNGGQTLYDEDPLQTFPGTTTGIPLNDNGEAMPFAVYTFWKSGTTALAEIFATSDLEGVQLDNPLTADENGEFPDIWLDDEVEYRVNLKDGVGVFEYDIDPYPLLLDPAVFMLAGEAEGAIGFDTSFVIGSITGDINEILPTAQSLSIRRCFIVGASPLTVRIQGSVSTPPADVFSRLAFRDKDGVMREFLTSAATTTTPATRTRQWSWGGTSDYFEDGGTYRLVFNP